MLSIDRERRDIIELTDPEYQIHMAVKDSVYENFFRRASIQDVLAINSLLSIVVDMEKEEIIQWIN